MAADRSLAWVTSLSHHGGGLQVFPGFVLKLQGFQQVALIAIEYRKWDRQTDESHIALCFVAALNTDAYRNVRHSLALLQFR